MWNIGTRLRGFISGNTKSDLLCSAIYNPTSNTNTKQEQGTNIVESFRESKDKRLFTDHFVWFKRKKK
jgi:hypothetical protein